MSVKRKLICLLVVLLIGVGQTPMPAAAQVLRFEPDPYTPSEPQFVVPLVLESGGHLVKGVEVEVAFDLNLVSLDSLTPGPWFNDSGQDFFFWDYTTPGTGVIHFASALLDGTQDTDAVIAFCHLSVQAFGLCPLEFNLVKVRDGANASLPVSADPGLIILDPAVATERSTLEGVKALYR